MAIRVVAGTARGRRLETPPGNEVRPTIDRVREAVFNALGSQHVVVGASVLDLFAGSGALGIEALSRGADRAVFVDTSARSIEVVRSNLDATGLDDRATVVRSDALDHLSTTSDRFDLVLADPPYVFDGWDALWSALAPVAPGGIVVAESDRSVPIPASATVLRERRYGGTVVTIISMAGPDPLDPQESEDLT